MHSMEATILIVEDEPSIRQLLHTALSREGLKVLEAANTALADAHIANGLPSLVLLDWMMPGESGISYVRRLRRDELTRELTVILLTARDGEADVINGLDAGADDYITKPFSPRELVSRVKAHLRRREGFGSDQTLQVGPLALDPSSYTVQMNEQSLAIKGSEFRLLKFLMEHPNRVYSRAQLLDHVWGRNAFLEERTVDVHILRLRKLLKASGADKLVQTIRGAGYKLSADSSVSS